MEINTKMLKRVISWYFLLGGVGFLGYSFIEFGFAGYLEYLVPAIITLSVLMLFIISGIACLKNPAEMISGLLLKICLMIHSFQFILIGFLFKNYYGPYLGVGFTDEPYFRIKLEFQLFAFRFSNGYNHNSDEISVVVNLIPIAILMLLTYLEKKEQESIKFDFDKLSEHSSNDRSGT